MHFSYLLVGGDARQQHLLSLLTSAVKSAEGIFIKTEENEEEALKKIENADIVILPIPSSTDGKFLFAPNCENKILLTSITKRIKEKTVLFTGGENSAFTAAKAKIKVNLLDNEEMTLKNAMATSEAALAILIENTEKTLFGSNILIIGYGRIANILAEYLKALKANVTVCARKEIAKTKAYIAGHTVIGFDMLNESLPSYNVIINTAPAPVLCGSELKNVSTEVLLLDLASKPGGIDFKAAKELGLKTIHALSLPGKYSSKSAAEYIEEVINNTII